MAMGHDAHIFRQGDTVAKNNPPLRIQKDIAVDKNAIANAKERSKIKPHILFRRKSNATRPEYLLRQQPAKRHGKRHNQT